MSAASAMSNIISKDRKSASSTRGPKGSKSKTFKRTTTRRSSKTGPTPTPALQCSTRRRRPPGFLANLSTSRGRARSPCATARENCALKRVNHDRSLPSQELHGEDNNEQSLRYAHSAIQPPPSKGEGSESLLPRWI